MLDLIKLTEQATATALGKYPSKADSVTWKATHKDGKAVATSSACYAPAFNHDLGNLEIQCSPWTATKKKSLAAFWYRRFFDLVKTTGLVVPEAEFAHKDGANLLTIPASGWDRHTVYITLCLYRQADVHPAEIMKIVYLWNRLKKHGVSFLQCLYYGIATTKFNSGHYFMSPGPYGGRPNLDLSNIQVLAWFGRLSLAERLELCPHQEAEKEAKRKAGQYMYGDPRSTYGMFGKEIVRFPSQQVKVLPEVLNPEHAALVAASKEEVPQGEVVR